MVKEFKTDGLKEFSTADLSTPWGEVYDGKIYGEAVDADAVFRAQNHVTELIDASETKDFADALTALPGPGESIHAVIGFRHSMGNLLPAIARLSRQTIEECFVATLTFSKQNALDWCAMLDIGTISKLTVICSHYFSKTSPDIYDAALPILQSRGATVAPLRCHAKILLCRLADGRTISAEGSANTRSAKTVEQVVIFGDPKLYEFHRSWMEKLIGAAMQRRGIQAGGE